MYFMMQKTMLSNFAKTIKIFTVLLLSTSSAYSYADEVGLAKYQQANIAVTYKGGVGELGQQLAEKLGIGYYALQHHSAVQVTLKQSDAYTIQHLLDQANQQLAQQQSHQQLRFDVLGDQVVLALVGNNVSLSPTQFIGNVVYNNVTTIPKPPHQGQNEYTKNSISSELKESDKKEVISPTKPVENSTQLPQVDKAEYSKESEAQKLRDILALSQDDKLIAQYAKRKEPVYHSDDRQVMGLETIRSTKISTFLIFKDGIDMTQYKIEGQFQELAVVGNVVAILHRQKSPPKEILIISPDQKFYKLTKVK